MSTEKTYKPELCFFFPRSGLTACFYLNFVLRENNLYLNFDADMGLGTKKMETHMIHLSTV
jgi:hypothetical protein